MSIALAAPTKAFSAFVPKPLGGSLTSMEHKRIKIDVSLTKNAVDITPLKSCIALILRGQDPSDSIHTLTAISRRLSPSQQDEIRQAVRSELDKRISELAREWRGSIMSREAGWLGRLVGGWKIWQVRTNLLAAVLVHIDAAPSIKEMATEAFKNGVWENPLFYQKTRDDLLGWSATERTAGVVAEERAVVKDVAALAKALSVWATVLEPYLDQIDQYYGQPSEKDGMEHVDWILTSVSSEQDRALVLAPNIDTDSIIHQHASRDIIPKAMAESIESSNAQALGRLYGYCIDINAFGQFATSLEAYIEKRLSTIIADASEYSIIGQVLSLKQFADHSVRELGHTSDLRDAIHSGFKAGLGSRQNAPAEWIAKYLDESMRKGQGSGTEAEFNTLLDEVIALIGFTPDKDIFKAFYSAGLAKRLLLGKSASDDMERNMIVKLQKEMGDDFTSGDIMMKDLQLSESLVKSYNDPTGLSVNVLTESAWPAYPLLKWPFKLPPVLQTSVDRFGQWYNNQHKNRQLSWRWQLATVTLVARFGKKRYEIGVSLFQAVVLLCFNEDDELSFEEIKDRTGIESDELARILQSLSIGRKGTRVLTKSTKVKDVAPTDKFAYNDRFTSDRVKFRINQIQTDLSAEETKATNEQVAIDRVSVLEATIVRIMKGKKKLTLQLLMDEVVRDVSKRFPPDVKEIKKRVESLIEREFLMRDDGDRNLLHYLA